MFSNPSTLFPSQPQQNPQNPALGNPFGGNPANPPSLFGQTSTPTFGSTPQPAPTLFGNQNPSAPNFGNAKPAFGQASFGSQPTPSPFGATPSQVTPFNQSQNLGGQSRPFGNLGQPNPPTPNLFQNQPAQSQPFGSFGNSGITPSPFSQVSTNPLSTPSFALNPNAPKPGMPSPFGGTTQPQGQLAQTTLFQSTFPSSNPSPFSSAPQAPTTNQGSFNTPFGGTQTQNPLNTAQIFSLNPLPTSTDKPFSQFPSFGNAPPGSSNQKPNNFNAPTFGLPNQPPLSFSNQKGTMGKAFQVLNNQKNNKVNTITFMPEYQRRTVTLLRLDDYLTYKNNPSSITNNVVQTNLATYFKNTAQANPLAQMGQGNQLNPGFTSPLKQQGGLGGMLKPVQGNTLFPSNPSPAFPGFPTQPQENKSGLFNPGPSTGPLFGNQPQQSPAFPSLNLTSAQPKSDNLFTLPSNQQPSSLFPMSQQNPGPSLFPAQNNQSSLLTNLQQPNQGPGLSFNSYNPGNPNDNKSLSLFPQTGQQTLPSLFPTSQQPVSPFGLNPMSQTGKFDLTLKPSTPGGGMFEQKGSVFPQMTNAPVDPLFDPAKASFPIANYNQPQLGYNQMMPAQPGTNVFNPTPAVSNPFGSIFGDVQKGPFAIYCFPLDSKGFVPKLMQQFNEGASHGNLISTLDDELRSLKIGSAREYDQVYPYNYGHEQTLYEPVEDDYYSTRNYNTYQRFKEAKNTIKHRLEFNKAPYNYGSRREGAFSRKAQNQEAIREENQQAFTLAVDLQLPDNKSTTVTTNRFKPTSMVAEVVKYLVEDKQLVDASDVPSLSFYAKGKKLNVIWSLREAGLVDNDVLTVSLESESDRSQKLRDLEKPYLPILTKKDYACKPSVREMSQMAEEQLAALPSFEIANQHAKIEFEGPVDVRKLNLDKIVFLNERSVEIYPVVEYESSMPAPGQELNRPCLITFFHLVKGPIKDFSQYVNKINKMAQTMNAQVRSIDSNTGAVTIAVDAFK